MFSRKMMLKNRRVWIPLAVVMVGLVAGIYFAFNPFPAGPSIKVSANVREVSGDKAVAPAVIVYESGAPLHYSGKVIRSSATSAAFPAPKHLIDAGYLSESGAPLHYSGKVIVPGAPCVPSSTIPQHYIDAGYALKQKPQSSNC